MCTNLHNRKVIFLSSGKRTGVGWGAVEMGGGKCNCLKNAAYMVEFL